MLLRLVLVSSAMFCLAGCDVLADAFRGGTVGPVEVWNTTTEPIFLVDEDGRRIDVPACGHAEAEPLNLELVQVRTEAGYIYGFGTRPDGGTQYLVFVAADGASDLSTIPPVAIPPCQGRPNVQIGV